jgi:hypothetical protein
LYATRDGSGDELLFRLKIVTRLLDVRWRGALRTRHGAILAGRWRPTPA